MFRFLIKWLVNIIALFIVINTISGVRATNSQALIVAALIIGLLNAFLRPVLILLTMPFTIFSLGLFTLFINGFMFYLASKFVIGFTVVNFWSAFCAALLFSVISFILNLILSPRQDISLKFDASNFNPIRSDRSKKIDNVIDVEASVVDDAKEDTK